MLVPRYDEEVNVLDLGSGIRMPWVYGVDIDGTIIFDLNAERLLVNVEVLIPKKMWRVAPQTTVPYPKRSATLTFSERTIRHKSFSLPITIYTNRQRTSVLILFDDAMNNNNAWWVKLSHRCFAAVQHGRLVGFLAWL